MFVHGPVTFAARRPLSDGRACWPPVSGVRGECRPSAAGSLSHDSPAPALDSSARCSSRHPATLFHSIRCSTQGVADRTCNRLLVPASGHDFEYTRPSFHGCRSRFADEPSCHLSLSAACPRTPTRAREDARQNRESAAGRRSVDVLYEGPRGWHGWRIRDNARGYADT